VTDRLLKPGNAFAFEGASAADRLGHRQRLIIIDRQLDGVGKPLAHRAGDRELLLELGMAEPQLHGGEPPSEQLLGFVRSSPRRHEAQSARVVGRDRLGLGSEEGRQRQARGDGEGIPQRRVEPGERHTDHACYPDKREAPAADFGAQARRQKPFDRQKASE